MWRSATKRAGVEGAVFHDLRHYYTALLIRHGDSVKVVQARLGHATAASEDRTRERSTAFSALLRTLGGLTGPSSRKTQVRARVGDEPACKPGGLCPQMVPGGTAGQAECAVMRSRSVSRRCHSWSRPVSQPRKITHSQGVSYKITYRVDGRMVRRRFPTKQAAADAAARARSEVLDGTHIAPAEGRTTVAAYVARWLQTLHVRPGTFHNYEIYLRCHVLPVLGARSLASLRRSDIQALVGQLSRKGLKPRTVDSIYKIVAMVMRSACTTG